MLSRIPVVFATDKNYMFYTCVAITSLANSAGPNTGYDVFILTSDEFTERSILDLIPQRYPNIQVNLIRVPSNRFQNVVINNKHISKATFYRLIIAEFVQVDKCIYLDSDVLVTEDLDALFSVDLSDHYIAGCRDIWMDMLSEEKYEEMRDSIGISSMEDYINAGVLLINLRKIREEHFDQVLVQYLDRDYPHEDQDILNVCCLGRIKRLPAKWNLFTIFMGKIDEMRAKGIDETIIQAFKERSGIIHYATPNIRPWEHFFYWANQQWWETASDWKDEDHYQELRKKVYQAEAPDHWRYYLEKCEQYQRIVIFGFTVYGREVCDQLLNNGLQERLLFCDNDPKKVGLSHKKVRTIFFDAVKKEGTLFINSSQRRSVEVTKLLLDSGVERDDIICYKRKRREYYIYLDNLYYLDELRDIFSREYGEDQARSVEDLQVMKRKLLNDTRYQDLYGKYYLRDWLLKGE